MEGDRGTRAARGQAVEIVGRLPPGVRTADVTVPLLAALAGLGVAGTVALCFAGDRTLRLHNRRFRGVDRATDVLSFPDGTSLGGVPNLGDVLISRDRARVQARAAGLTLRREVQELALHGLLHLLGHDHETDGGEMDRLELRLRARLLDGQEEGSRRERVALGAATARRRERAPVPRAARSEPGRRVAVR